MGEVDRVRGATLCEVGEVVGGLLQSNPINGDGSNYTLRRLLSALDRMAGDDSPSDSLGGIHGYRSLVGHSFPLVELTLGGGAERLAGGER